MNKFLLLLGLITTSFLNAQKVGVLVNSPTTIAGEKNFGNSAFGADLTTGLWTGDCAIAESITACATLTNAAAINGKIAVIDRGSCNFDVKCLNAQNAGAIAVVVLNHNDLANRGGDVPFRMGRATETISVQVTIPCVMLGYSDGVALKEEIAKGTVNMTLGAFPKEVNDLSITRTVCDGSFSQPLVLFPKYGAIPSNQITSIGDMVFYPGGSITNVGTANQNDIKLNCIIKNGNTDLYNKSNSSFNLEVDSTKNEILSDPFDYNGLSVGQYGLEYNAINSAQEKFVYDNKLSSYFDVTSNFLSKCRFNVASRTPVTSGAYFFGGGTAYRELMMPFRMKHGKGMQLDSVFATISTGTGGTVAGLYLEGRIYRWDDINADNDISSDEMLLVALGSMSFDGADTRGSATFAIGLENLDGNETVYTLKNDNELYFASIQYPGGSTNVFFGYDSDFNGRLHLELKDASNELDFEDYPFLQAGTQDVSGGPDMSTAGLFYFDCNSNQTNEDETVYSPSSISLFVSKAVVSNKDISNEKGVLIELTPNPAIDELRASIRLNEISKVSYHIVDMGGKIVFSASENTLSNTYNPIFNVNQMSPGQYYLQVNTSKGFVKKGFVVIK
ncbi:MAG: T9SS type A sorting domain-containing protein [Saprospiraceae bacterium]|nr:T9SS type A sorting domain-containing protein [Saprospiraceae bacterium]